MNELIELWKRTLGEPPTEAQFAIWEGLHTPEVMKRAILRTLTKAGLTSTERQSLRLRRRRRNIPSSLRLSQEKCGAGVPLGLVLKPSGTAFRKSPT